MDTAEKNRATTNPSSSNAIGSQQGQSGSSGMDEKKQLVSDKAHEAADKAKDVTSQAKDKASDVHEKATQSADQGMDKASQGLDKAADMVRDRVEGDDRVPDQVGMVADKLDSAAGYLKEKDTDQLVSDLEALVRRKPVESVVGAVAIGFFLAKALR